MTDAGRWWESFFEGLWLDWQLGPPLREAGAPHAAVIAKLLGLERGSRVLDAPCGEGRIARGLAALGCDVTGADLSKALLTAAHRRAEEAGASIEFERHDVRHLPYRERFDAVVCYWGSFGYFDDVGNLEQFCAAARALVPGGQLLLDGHVTETLFPKFSESDSTELGEFVVGEERRWNAAAGRVEVDWTLSRGAETDTRTSSMRIYSVRELTHLLHAAGFHAISWYGGIVGEPFELGADRAVVVARV